MRTVVIAMLLAVMSGAGGCGSWRDGRSPAAANRSGGAAARDRVAERVLVRGHSHNDYRQARPLDAALERGYCSIEADVFLVGGELLVAHDRRDCRAERTLRGMYLEPLAERATSRAEQTAPGEFSSRAGWIYAGHAKPIILLVDIKAEGEAAYAVLDRQLRETGAAGGVWTKYAGAAGERADGIVTAGAVTVVISGSIPRAMIASQEERYAFVDGRPPDLERAVGGMRRTERDGAAGAEAERPAAEAAGTGLVPLVSMPWLGNVKWVGIGPIPEPERERLRAITTAAHERGYLLRFWGVPADENVWREMMQAGVDFINVDDLERGKRFLESR